MRVLSRLARKGLSFSSIGQTFDQGPLWAQTPLWMPTSGDREQIETDFLSYVQRAYKRNGVVYTCVTTRQLIFSEARFQFRRFVNGRPSSVFGGESLSLLERPWPNGTTGELLASMEGDLSLAGNWFGTAVGTGSERRIRRLRPDWVTIVTGSPSDDPFDIEARPIGYIYEPKPRVGAASSTPVLFTPDQVVHYSFPPDPEAQWRGMSWITPVLREIEGDQAATTHKLKFFQNGTTSNFVVTYDAGLTSDQFKQYVEAYKRSHAGVDNAYKTIHLGGGADVHTVGADLKQLDFKMTQGAGETRIAAASGLGAIVAQFSEGMQGSSLNAGNYGAARRRVADGLFRPLWRVAAASLEKFTTPPSGAHLWYADRDIPFLREDAKIASEIEAIKASTINSYVREGFTAESAKAAVDAQDVTLLKHTDLLSVQLQPAGTTAAPTDDPDPVEE